MEQIQTLVKTEQKVAKTGRPRAITRTKVAKLEHCLKFGHTIEYACNFAGIDKSTYFREIKRDESFATKMEIAKHHAKHKALETVEYYLDKKDLETSKWWLEHKYSKEFSKSPDTAVQINNFTVDFIDDEGEIIEVS